MLTALVSKLPSMSLSCPFSFCTQTYFIRIDSTSTKGDTEAGKMAASENTTYVVSIHVPFNPSFISLLLVVPRKMSR